MDRESIKSQRDHTLLALESGHWYNKIKMLYSMRRYGRILALLLLSATLAFTYIKPCLVLNRRLCPSVSPSVIYNRTLGFERVFSISLPERSDKRDNLVIASSFTGFDIEWSDGVSFDTMSPKAVPPNWNYQKRTNGSLACWRAHMNLLQRIVHEKIQTALILEDDSDFDFSIKRQLYEFAEGARALQHLEDIKSNPTLLRSPYGDDWDFLWLGHCKLGPKNDRKEFYVQDNDPTVAPLIHRNSLWTADHVPDEVLRNDTRLVFKADNGGLCMYAYAVTYEGARKALSAISVVPQDDVVDMSYRRLCQGRLNVPYNCYGGYPTLFGSHRAAGPRSRDSDLNAKSEAWHEEYTFDMVYSTMRNIPALAAGADTLTAQFPGMPPWPAKGQLANKGRVKIIDLEALPLTEIQGVNRPRA